MSAEIHGLSGAYALDALEPDERALFEAHLAECAECREEVSSLREAVTSLSEISPASPSPTVRRAVLEQIRSVRPLPPVGEADAGGADGGVEAGRGASGGGAGGGAAGGGAAGSGGAGGGGAGSGGAGSGAAGDGEGVLSVPSPLPRRRVLRWVGAAAAAAVVGGVAWTQLAPEPQPRLTAAERVIRASDAHRYEQSMGGGHTLTIVRSPSLRRAVLIAEDMPAAPAGHDYQAWLDLPGRGMVSAGVLRPDASSTMMVVLEGDAGAATGAGVTMEPAGGSPAPTGEPMALIAFT